MATPSRTPSTPALGSVASYYDARIEGKLRDFVDANPRIEAAVHLIGEWAPLRPRRILEVGCGIGATCWRMARAWPSAQIIGTDISARSIEVANACFQRSNLAFQHGAAENLPVDGSFDLIVLMDVYEHIAPAARPELLRRLRGLLSPGSRAVVTVPTPAMLAYLRQFSPAEVQPVDEDIDIGELQEFGRETATQLLYYRRVGIWRRGDYAHAVFGRFDALAPLSGRSSDVRRGWLRDRWVRWWAIQAAAWRLRSSAQERQQAAARWLDRGRCAGGTRE